MWMALTGARLKAADCELLGIASDVVEAAKLEAFKAAVISEPENAEGILAEYEADAGRAAIIEHRDEIDRLFAGDSVEAIVAALEAEGSEWALAQRDVIATKSPTSLKVAHRLVTVGADFTDFAQDMRCEHRISRRLAVSADFIEGVRAVIVDKDNAPRWSPATLGEVTEADIDAIFAPLPEGEGWTPLPDLALP
jgi:enoyl-CoA hydratase